jgi:hypothetical protein
VPYTTADLERAERRIAQAERNLSRQAEIVSGLANAGHATELALELLHEFEASVFEYRGHLDRVRRLLNPEGQPPPQV